MALQRVKARLQVVVPLTLAVIALLLYLTFGSVAEMLIVMLSLPFALVGGVWVIWLLDYNLSIAVAVGFIALAGVAAETGVVMLLYLDHAWADITQGGRRPSRHELVGAIEYGAVNRLRPKLMTVAAIMLGLLPALWSHGTGAEVMQRIAAPMVGGMVTSTILTLVVIPAVYYLWRRRGLEGAEGAGLWSREPHPVREARHAHVVLGADGRRGSTRGMQRRQGPRRPAGGFRRHDESHGLWRDGHGAHGFRWHGDGRHEHAGDGDDVRHARPHGFDDADVAPADAGDDGEAPEDDVAEDGRDGRRHAGDAGGWKPGVDRARRLGEAGPGRAAQPEGASAIRTNAFPCRAGPAADGDARTNDGDVVECDECAALRVPSPTPFRAPGDPSVAALAAVGSAGWLRVPLPVGDVPDAVLCRAAWRGPLGRGLAVYPGDRRRRRDYLDRHSGRGDA
ncbi:MAG: efflux RND transporter permease subunit [Gemmatimonadales bacterium]|nr:efflux RND transporter permease subunit [Gemmatimonadales bacterium]